MSRRDDQPETARPVEPEDAPQSEPTSTPHRNDPWDLGSAAIDLDDVPEALAFAEGESFG